MANIRGDQAMVRIVATVARKRAEWMLKVSRAGPNEDSSVDKKQKKIADQ